MMDTLIRAAKLGSEPLVLRRTSDRLRGSLAAEATAANNGSPTAVVPPVADRRSAAVASDGEHWRVAAPAAGHEPAAAEPVTDVKPTIEPPVAPVRISYEDYEQRLGAELEQRRQAARDEGYAQGLEQAREQVQAEYAGELEHLRGLVQSARATLEQQIEGLTDIGGEIVYEAVTRIIGRAYLDPQGITAVVREVIRQAKERSRLVVRVHPDDQPVLAACAEELVAGLNVGQIEVLGDDRVALGGCLLETPAGNLDGRLEIQLQQLQDALRGARARHAEAAGEP